MILYICTQVGAFLMSFPVLETQLYLNTFIGCDDEVHHRWEMWSKYFTSRNKQNTHTVKV